MLPTSPSYRCHHLPLFEDLSCQSSLTRGMICLQSLFPPLCRSYRFSCVPCSSPGLRLLVTLCLLLSRPSLYQCLPEWSFLDALAGSAWCNRTRWHSTRVSVSPFFISGLCSHALACSTRAADGTTTQGFLRRTRERQISWSPLAIHPAPQSRLQLR